MRDALKVRQACRRAGCPVGWADKGVVLTVRKFWIVGGLVATALAVAGGMAYWRGHHYQGPINALQIDLAHPQVYVATPSLSSLPRDLVKAPVLRDLLTEDFAFYYEEHEDRLGLQGAIKRIAFEHQTTLSDELLALALDQPADLAAWVDSRGAPRHWVMAMTRGALAKTLQGLATVAASDGQLSLIAPLKLNGSEVPVYALKLSPRRTLALASLGNRVVVLSDPGLLFNEEREVDPTARKVLADLLSGDRSQQAVLARGQGLSADEATPTTGHVLVADARWWSLGYGSFFPGLKALRLHLASGGKSLDTALRLDGDATLQTLAAGQAVWVGLPTGAAACSLLPVDWTVAQALIGAGSVSPASPELTAAWTTLISQADGPAAVCWYARSQLHTPLVVMRSKAPATALAPALATLSDWLWTAKSQPAEPTETAGVQRWQRVVQAPWGSQGEGDEAVYRPTLAQQGPWITLSPDQALTDQSLKAQAHQFPSLADSWAAQPGVLLLDPRQIADLLQREAYQVLPSSEPALRQAADQHLLPRLAALRRQPAVAVQTEGTPDAQGWLPLRWVPRKNTAP
jgi:uncharacterized protein YfaA (DUF2138 family)